MSTKVEVSVTAKIVTAEPQVVLTMPYDVAVTLAELFWYVSGHGDKTYRAHLNRIAEALGEAGVDGDGERLVCATDEGIVAQNINTSQE